MGCITDAADTDSLFLELADIDILHCQRVIVADFRKNGAEISFYSLRFVACIAVRAAKVLEINVLDRHIAGIAQNMNAAECR